MSRVIRSGHGKAPFSSKIKTDKDSQAVIAARRAARRLGKKKFTVLLSTGTQSFRTTEQIV